MVMKKLLVFLLYLIILPLCNATIQVGIGGEDDEIGINFDPPTTVISINGSLVDTNASTECSGDEVLLGDGSCVSSGGLGVGNLSFNESRTNKLYIKLVDESNLNVNSSTWWAEVSSWATDWFLKIGNVLSFNQDKLNNTIELVGVNAGFNSSHTIDTDTNASTECNDGFYLDGSSSCIHFNNTVSDLGDNKYLNLSGTNANQNINIGAYNFTAPWFFGDTINPVNPFDLANKNYIDNAVSGINFDFFFSNHSSDIASYYNLTDETGHSSNTLSSVSLGTGNDQLIFNYSTELGEPNFNQLIAGVYEFHLHLSKTGTKPTQVYVTLSNRSADGTENLLVTSEPTELLTDSPVPYNPHGILDNDVDLEDTDRLVVKLYANVGATGNPVVISIYQEGSFDSRISIRTNTGAFVEGLNNFFLRIDGGNSPIENINWNNKNLTQIFKITASDWSNVSGSQISNNLNWINQTTGDGIYIKNNTDDGYVGFFNIIGSLLKRIKTLFVIDIESNGTINANIINSSLINSTTILKEGNYVNSTSELDEVYYQNTDNANFTNMTAVVVCLNTACSSKIYEDAGGSVIIQAG